THTGAGAGFGRTVESDTLTLRLFPSGDLTGQSVQRLSFHGLLPALLRERRSAPLPGGPDDRSRPRAAGRRGAWQDRPRPSAPSAPGTSRAGRGMRPAPRARPRPRTQRPRTTVRGSDRTPGRRDHSLLGTPDAAGATGDPAHRAS